MPGAVVEPEQAPAQEVEAPAAPEPPIDPTPPREYTVISEQISLDIDFREKSIKGRADIYVTCRKLLSEVFIDSRQCDVDVNNITVSGCPTTATYDDPYVYADSPESYVWSAQQWQLRKSRMRPLLHRRRKELSAIEHEEQFSCTPANGSLRVTIPSRKDIQASLAKLREQASNGKTVDQWDKVILENDDSLAYKISIPFMLRNIRDGLHFVGVDEADSRYPHIYTRHSIEPGTASSLFPCIDDPGCRSAWKISITFPRTLGDAFHQPLATQQPANGSLKRKYGEEARRRQYSLTEEDKLLEMTVVCSGRLEDEMVNQDDETKKTMTFGCEYKSAQHIGFAVGPFEHVDLWSEFRSEEDDERLGTNATKIHGYCLPGRADEVRNTCAALVTAIDHFAVHFGRYPFESYKVCFVDDMVADCVPLCAFSLCSSRILYPPEIIDHEIDVTRTLVHSLASQWFGVNIVPNQKQDIWLVAGIAWFMTDLFMKKLCGTNDYRFRLKLMADRLVEVDMNRPSLQSLGDHLHLGDFEVDFMNLKAPLVLFILDRRLSKYSGSSGIPRIIGKMVSKANTSGMSSDQILDSNLFRRVCEKHGQTRLESFWNQWVIGSGCPRFDVFQKFNKKRLCVEMTIRQIQDIAAAKAKPLDKDSFWRDVMEENHAVYAGELQHAFTGQMTIRIHEADGTPYEHIVEIRDSSAKAAKFEIPYNTKYKRLKRKRRQQDRQLAGAVPKANEESQEDALLYCLGDVLQTEEDNAEWGFVDWDEATEQKMDQESYEWIRMDADFEWICNMKTNMPPYMYVSQLQQDRDIVAQQDSMLYLDDSSDRNPHPLIATILTRTLGDRRYFHGIRTMAAEILPKNAKEEIHDWVALKHLRKMFQELFCFDGTFVPRPNDFSDKRQYLVQSAIPAAMARIRDKEGKCPKASRRFILQQLQCNDNSENCYSDNYYVCKLITALAVCQIPGEKTTISFKFGDDDEEHEHEYDPEPDEFKRSALEEIERYRRMDEYSPSYQNCYTVAALDALCRLMKANVIKQDPLVFIQYLQDRTLDNVRIKSFEALAELGMMSKRPFLRLLLSVIATDASPFVRDRLFRIFCRGLASIAIGEHEQAGKKNPVPNENNGLIVESDTAIIEARQKEKARKEDLPTALAALKESTKDDETLEEVVWNALESPVLSVAERRNMLELCSILFEEDDQLIMRLKYPTAWTASRGEKIRGRLMVDFKRHFRTKSRKPYVSRALPQPPPSAPRPEPKRTITLNLNRNPSFSQAVTPVAKPAVTVVRPAGTPKSTPKSGSPAPVRSAEVGRESISVQTPRTSIEMAAPAPAPKPSGPGPSPARGSVPPPERKALPGAGGSVKMQSSKAPGCAAPKTNGARAGTPSGLVVQVPKSLKRQSTDASEGQRPTKIVKLNTKNIPASAFASRKRSRIVTVKFKSWHKLKLKQAKARTATPEAGSIRATRPPSTKERSNSIIVQSSGGSSQSPQQSTPTTATANNSFTSAGGPGSQVSAMLPTQSQSQGRSAGVGSASKPARKPLPSGERKPLPSGGRNPLPTAAPHSHSTTTPAANNNSSPNISAAPKKLKIKLKTPRDN